MRETRSGAEYLFRKRARLVCPPAYRSVTYKYSLPREAVARTQVRLRNLSIASASRRESECSTGPCRIGPFRFRSARRRQHPAPLHPDHASPRSRAARSPGSAVTPLRRSFIAKVVAAASLAAAFERAENRPSRALDFRAGERVVNQHKSLNQHH